MRQRKNLRIVFAADVVLIFSPNCLRNCSSQLQTFLIIGLNVVAPEYAGLASHLGGLRECGELERDCVTQVIRFGHGAWY